MNIFVTGGTGFIGSHIVEALAISGYNVSALYRSAKKIPAGLSGYKNIHWVKGDYTRFSEWAGKLKDQNVIINATGIIKETSRSKFSLVHTNVPLQLFLAAEDLGIKRVIQISAAGVNGKLHLPYFLTKMAADNCLIESTLRYTIFRPSLVYSNRSASMQTFLNLLKLPLVPVIGFGEYLFQPVYVRDLADAVVKSLLLPKAERKIIEIGGPEILSYNQILDLLVENLGLKKHKRVYLPVSMARFFINWFQHLPGFPITKDQLTMLLEGSIVDTTGYKSLLNLPQKTFAQAIRENSL